MAATYEQAYVDLINKFCKKYASHLTAVELNAITTTPMTIVLAMLLERGKVYEDVIERANLFEMLEHADHFPLPDRVLEIAKVIDEETAVWTGAFIRHMYRFAREFLGD